MPSAPQLDHEPEPIRSCSRSALRVSLNAVLDDALSGTATRVTDRYGNTPILIICERDASAEHAGSDGASDQLAVEIRRAEKAVADSARYRRERDEAQAQANRAAAALTKAKDELSASHVTHNAASWFTREVSAHLHDPVLAFRITKAARDALAGGHERDLASQWAKRTGRIPEPRWEAFFAAAVTDELRRRNQPQPAWCSLALRGATSSANPFQPLPARPARRHEADDGLWAHGIRVRADDWAPNPH